jgi:HlyD family secretion protein
MFRIIIIFAVGIIAGAIPAYLLGESRLLRHAETTGIPSARPITKVAARGRLEPAKGITNLAPAGADRLREIKVHDGEVVKEGQELANLDSLPLRTAERDLARQQLEEARARLKPAQEFADLQIREAEEHIAAVKKQSPLDVEVQNAKISALTKQCQNAQDLLERMKKVASYTEQERKQQGLVVHQAEEELKGAKTLLEKINAANSATLNAAHAQLDSAKAGRNKAISEIPIGSLQKSLDLAEERLKYTVVRAPFAGKVLKVLTRPGELVGTQPLIQMADLSHMVVVTEVYETDVGLLRDWKSKGELRATIRANPLPANQSFEGTVESIANMIARNTTFSLDPRQDADRRVVEVRIRLRDQDAVEAAKFINMQVDVFISEPSVAAAP